MRLTDADKLKEELIKALHEDLMDIDEAIDVVVTTIDDAPTVDPVKHGHWIEQEHEDWKWSKEYRCSECGKYRLMTNPFGREWNYCPNCGAHMGVEDGVERK